MRLIRHPLLALAVLLSAATWSAGASVALSAGGAGLRFHDPRLRDLYPHPLALRVRVEVARIDGVPLTLAAGYAWASRETAPSAFVDDSRVRMRFVPVCLQAPYAMPLGRGWVGRAGPQMAWAWFREDWNASVQAAGVTAAGHGTGTWLAGGALLEIDSSPRRWGTLRLGVAGMWASAHRGTERGNAKHEEAMKGGWDEIYLEWAAPAP
jgi:hypothetical protein